MGILNSLPLHTSSYNDAYILPVTPKKNLVIIKRPKSGTYIQSHDVYDATATSVTAHDAPANGFSNAVSLGETLGHTTIEKVDGENIIMFESRAETNLLGLGVPPSAVFKAYFFSFDTPNIAVGGVTNGRNVSFPSFAEGLGYTTGGVPGKTDLDWPAHPNGGSYYTWQVLHSSAKVSENQYVMWGYASDIRESDDVGKANIMALRYTTAGPADRGPWTKTLEVEMWWRNGSTSTRAASGTGYLTITVDPWDFGTATTINYTIDYEFVGEPPTASPFWENYTRIQFEHQGGFGNFNFEDVYSGSVTYSRSFNADVNYLKFTAMDVGGTSTDMYSPNVTFWNGAKAVYVDSFARDSATALHEEYIGSGAEPTYDGYYSTWSAPVVIDGHLYSWTLDRAGAVAEVDVDLGTVLDVSVTTHASVPAKFNHEYDRISYLAGGGTLYDFHWAKKVTRYQTSVNSRHKTYSIDSTLPAPADTYVIPCLFGWAKSGGYWSSAVYAWGTLEATIAPYPLLEGTNTDVVVSWTARPPSRPSGAGGDWLGPYFYRKIDRTTVGVPAWTAASSATSTTLTGSFTVSTDALTGVRITAGDVPVASSAVVALSTEPPTREWLFQTHQNSSYGPLAMWDGEVEPMFYDDWNENPYNSVATNRALRYEYPYGHPDHYAKVLGMFTVRSGLSSLWVVPWTYMSYGADADQPPLKMQQRDDGLGPQGGPGRIGYYGRNGSRSIRLPLGGAW
jgi:hypothetical protein